MLSRLTSLSNSPPYCNEMSNVDVTAAVGADTQHKYQYWLNCTQNGSPDALAVTGLYHLDTQEAFEEITDEGGNGADTGGSSLTTQWGCASDPWVPTPGVDPACYLKTASISQSSVTFESHGLNSPISVALLTDSMRHVLAAQLGNALKSPTLLE